MSLLLANGHSHALKYPLGMLLDEERLVLKRINQAHATQAILTQLAVSGVLTKEAGAHFRKVVNGLIGED